MVGEMFRLNVSFFWGGRKNVSEGRAGIDPLTVLYMNFLSLVASSII